MTRLEKVVDEIGRMLPAETEWHMKRFDRFKDKGPFKLLIQVVLSHQTTIKIEDLAIDKLWTKFQTPKQLAAAKFADVDQLIKNVNYHPTKARRIIAISKEVMHKWNGSLDFLRNLSLDRSLTVLTSLPGVGRKTAGIVLLSIYKQPIMPVDTNVFRVSKELKLVGRKDDPDAVGEKLEQMLPKDPAVIAKAHNYLLALGQATRRGQNRWMLRKLRTIR